MALNAELDDDIKTMRLTANTVDKPPITREYEPPPHIQDTEEFARYKVLFRRALKRLEGKGQWVKQRAIHDYLGDKADRRMTPFVLAASDIYKRGLIPEQYSLKPPVVRSIPKSEWHRITPALPKYVNRDPKSFPILESGARRQSY